MPQLCLNFTSCLPFHKAKDPVLIILCAKCWNVLYSGFDECSFNLLPAIHPSIHPSIHPECCCTKHLSQLPDHITLLRHSSTAFPFFISRYKILPFLSKIRINWLYPPTASCSAPRHELLLAIHPCSEPLPPPTCLIFSSVYVLFQPSSPGSISLVTSSNLIILLQNADVNSSVMIPTKNWTTIAKL